MANYTELVFAIKLKDQTSELIKTTLYSMVNEEEITELPRHDFFKLGHDILFNAGGGFFPGQVSSFFDGIRLTVRTRVKENFYQLIERFLQWIASFSQTEGFVGYLKTETGNAPVLIYFEVGKAFLVKIENTKKIPVEEFIMPLPQEIASDDCT